MENRLVKRMQVSMIPRTAMMFFFWPAARPLRERRRITFLFLTLRITFTPLLDPAVLNADDPVSHLGDAFIMGNHHNSLVKFLARDL